MKCCKKICFFALRLAALCASVLMYVHSATAETRFSLKPYLMLGQMDGDLKTEGVPADFSLGWSNTFEKANGALGLDFDIRAEDFSVLSQFWYTTLSDTDTSVTGENYDAVQQDFDALFATEQFGLSLYKEENSFFELSAGGRFASVSNDLTYRTGGIETELSQSKTWVDPVVGFNAQIAFSDNTTFSFGGDYGGFDVASNQTWQAYGALNFSIKKNSAFSLGYRAMMHDYEKDDFSYNMLMQGPTIGLSLGF